MKEVRLPSGAKLKIQVAPFPDAKALYQALFEEGKGLKLDPNANIDVNFFKDLFLTGFSSRKIESAVWKCMDRALYNDLRITEDTFEPVEARDDYITTIFEVTQANIQPFMKSLSVAFRRITEMVQSDHT